MKPYIFILIVSVISQGLGYMANLILAKTLTIIDYSHYVTLYASVGLFITAALYGFSQYLLRQISSGNLINDYISYYARLSSCIFLILMIFYSFFNVRGLYLIPFGVLSIMSTYWIVKCQIERNFYFLSFGKIYINLARFIPAAVCLVLGLNDDNSFYILIAIVSALLGFVLLYQAKNFAFNFPHVSRPDLISATSKSFPFLISSLSYFIYYQSDVLVLSYYSLTDDVANYSLAITLMSAFILVAQSLYQTYLSSIFYSEYSKSSELGCRLMVVHVILMSIFSSLLFWIYYLIGDLILGYLIPQAYVNVISYFDVLLFAVFIRYISSPVSLMMNIEKYVKTKTYILVFSAIFNLALNLFFVKHYGAFSSAIITVATEFLVLLMMLYYTRREIKLGMSNVFKS